MEFVTIVRDPLAAVVPLAGARVKSARPNSHAGAYEDPEPVDENDVLDEFAQRIADVRPHASNSVAPASDRMRFEAKHGMCLARWGAPLHVEIELDRFGEERGELRAEVVVRFTAPGLEHQLLAPRRVPLLGTRAIADLARDLAKRQGDMPWPELLERAFTESISAHRQGEPAILLRDVPQRIDPLYELEPLVLRNLLTVLWGRPGEGKTLVAAAIAAAIATGRRDILGLAPRRRMRVLFGDWEQDEYAVGDSVRLVAGGDPVDGIVYLACRGAIWDELDRIIRVVREHGIEFLVLDSVGMACGGIPPESSEAALRFGTAVRRIGLGTLATAHVPKDVNANDSAPFGSIFWLAQLRLGWLVKREHEQEGDSFSLGLFAKKSNHDRLPAPLGYDVTFTYPADTASAAGRPRAEAARFRRRDLATASAELAMRIPIRGRLHRALASGPRIIHEVAEDLDEKADTVRKTLQRYEGKDFVRVPGTDGVDRWALLARDAS